MSENYTRDFHFSDFTIRADGHNRTIFGMVVPFGVTARVRDSGAPYDESFQRGAFTKTLAERGGRVKLLSQHDSRKPMGIATRMEEQPGGLYGEFKVSDTAYGNDQLELARDGVLDAFSVGFTPIAAKKDGSVTVRTEVALREVSLVTFPAYEGALVAGIRADGLSPANEAMLQLLLTQLAASDAAFDPFVEALCAADGALDQAQTVIAAILGVADPDPEDAMDMEMSSNLTSLARRLDAAFAARASATPSGAGTDEPAKGHSGRNQPMVWNNFLAEAHLRGIHP